LASRSISERESIVEEQVKPPTGVWLRSNFPGILKVTGIVTGKHYVFPENSTQEVSAEDVPNLLEKTFGGRGCCGSNTSATPYFTVME
jgi:hypothetical protein